MQLDVVAGNATASARRNGYDERGSPFICSERWVYHFQRVRLALLTHTWQRMLDCTSPEKVHRACTRARAQLLSQKCCKPIWSGVGYNLMWWLALQLQVHGEKGYRESVFFVYVFGEMALTLPKGSVRPAHAHLTTNARLYRR